MAARKVLLAGGVVLLAALALPGCGGGAPDISGEWSTEMRIADDEESTTVLLDLDQNAEDELDGSLSLTYLATPHYLGEEETISAPITEGSVSEDGSFAMAAGEGRRPMRFAGDYERGELTGEMFLGGEPYAVTATRAD